MRSIAQFTTAEGFHIGIPTMGGLIVMDVVVAPMEGQPPNAKTLVRYLVMGQQGGRVVFLRDPMRQVLSKLPVSACGPWAHMTEKDGNAIAFPQKSVCAYQQIDEANFDVSLNIPTGPVDVSLRTSLEDLVETGALDVSSEPDEPVQPEEGGLVAEETGDSDGGRQSDDDESRQKV